MLVVGERNRIGSLVFSAILFHWFGDESGRWTMMSLLVKFYHAMSCSEVSNNTICKRLFQPTAHPAKTCFKL